MARSNLGPPVALTALGPPACLESGDRFTDRSPPQGWRGLVRVSPWPSLRCAPQQASKVVT
eukprot:825104-Pyramimonas_sp.AAC.1